VGHGWPRRVGHLREPVEMAALALFAHAGTLKALAIVDRLPIDLTVASGAVVLVSMLARVASGKRLPVKLGVVVLFFVILAPSVVDLAPSDYASEKAFNLFTLTVLVAIAPGVLVASQRSADLLLTSLAFLGSFVAAVALVIDHRTEFTNRLVLGADGSAPIALGRLAGLAAVVLLAKALYGYRFRRTAAALAAVSAVTVVLTLSQGPLIATAIGGAVVLFGGRRHRNEGCCGLGRHRDGGDHGRVVTLRPAGEGTVCSRDIGDCAARNVGVGGRRAWLALLRSRIWLVFDKR